MATPQQIEAVKARLRELRGSSVPEATPPAPQVAPSTTEAPPVAPQVAPQATAPTTEPTSQADAVRARIREVRTTPLETNAPRETEPKGNILDQATGAISKGIDYASNLPGIKQIKEGVGGVFGLGGMAVGGATGAAIQTAKNVGGGRPLGEGVAEQAKKSALATGEFGQNLGEQGAIAAPFGALGKIPNAIMATTQLYQGGKGVYEGVKEGGLAGTEKAIEGGMDIGMGLLGARDVVRTKGLILNKGVFSTTGPKNIEKATKKLEEATGYSSRTGVQKEMADKTVKAARNNAEPPKNPNRTIAEEGKDLYPVIEDTPHGTRVYNTESPQIEAQNRVTSAEELLTRALEEANPLPQHDLVKLRDEIVAKVEDNSASTEKKMKKVVEEYFNDEIEKNGTVVTSGKLNDIKKGLYATGYNAKGDPARSDTASAYRRAAHRVRTEIENLNPGVPVRQTNKIISDLIGAGKYLKTVHGSQVRGSYFGKKFAGLVGSGAGRSTGIPIIGDLLGYKIGDAIYDTLSDPTRKLLQAENLTKGTVRPSESAQGKLYDALKNIYDKRGGGLKLGVGKPPAPVEPPAIPLGGKSGGVRYTQDGKTIIEGVDTKNPMTGPEKVRSQARAMGQGAEAKLRSGDFKAEDLTLIRLNDGRYYLHLKGYAPTAISKLEAAELIRSGMKPERFSTKEELQYQTNLEKSKSVSKQLFSHVKDILEGKKDGVTLNSDGTEYTGDKAIVTLYSENVPRAELTQQRINEVLAKKFHLFENSTHVKLGLFDMKNGMISVDVNLATSSRPLALQIAKANGQKAYYDPKGTDEATMFPLTGGDGVQKLSDQEVIDWRKKVAKFERHAESAVKGKYRHVNPEAPYHKGPTIDAEFKEKPKTVFGKKDNSPKLNEPNKEIQALADAYNKKKGLPVTESKTDIPFDEARAMRIADAFDAMKDTPEAPEVKRAYEALASETLDQYKAIEKAGYNIEPWEKDGQPYKNSAEMVADVKNNKHLWFFPTESGFGSGAINDHPLLKDSGVVVNGKKLKYNDIFRAVHEIFGHSKVGNQFGAKGEEIAWREHSKMYSPEARKAMTTETRGQNSWVNFGPQMRNSDGKLLKSGDKGYLNAPERKYADQKTGILPDEFIGPTDGNVSNSIETPSEKTPYPKSNFFGKKANTFSTKKAVEFPGGVEKNVVKQSIKLKPDFELAMPNKYIHTPSQITNRARAGGVSLREAIDYPELFEAYPSAKNITIRFGSLKKGVMGETQTRGGKPNFGKPREIGRGYGGTTITLAQGRSKTAIIDTLRHELQHWIQNKEGWAAGGDFYSIDRADVQLQVLLNMRKNMQNIEALRKITTIEDMQKMEHLIDQAKSGTPMTHEELGEVFGVSDKYATTENPENVFDRQAKRVYLKLLGEAEARGDIKPGEKYIVIKNQRQALDMIPDRPRTNFGKPKGENLVPIDNRFISTLTDVMSRENGLQLDRADVAKKIRSAYGMGSLTEAELLKLMSAVAPRSQDKQALVDEVMARQRGEATEAKPTQTAEVEKKVKNDQMYKKEYAALSASERREVNKIIELRTKGVTFQDIADILDISVASVQFKWSQYSKGLTGKY